MIYLYKVMMYLKKIGLGLSAVLVLLASSATILPQPKANALIAKDADIMCVPPLLELTDSLAVETAPDVGDNTAEHFKPNGSWLELRIINRATIQVIVNPGSITCQSPAAPDQIAMNYISKADRVGVLKSLLDKTMVDTNTADENYLYRDKSDDSSSDDQLIDNFDNPGDLNNITERFDKTNGHDGAVLVTQLRTHLRISELLFSFDNAQVDDDVANCKDDSEDNDNFILRIIDKKMVWSCENTILDSYKGISVADAYTNLENFNIVYAITGTGDATMITHVSKGEQDTRTFTYCPQVKKFVSENCKGSLTIDQTPEALAARAGESRILITINGNGGSVLTFASGATSAETAAQIQAPGGGSGSTGGATDEQEVSCEGNDNSGLGWIFCAAIRAIDGTLQSINNQVRTILRIDTAELENGGQLKDAWANVRDISSVLLVLFALIMVVSTALSIGPFDAYTIRKILPRLVAAVVLMQISWYLMIFMINVVNDIGGGVEALLLMPFGGSNVTDLSDLVSKSVDGSGLGFFNAAAAGAAVFTGLSLGLLGILSLAFTAILAVVIGFAVLLLRNIVIIAALIFAPLAIVCYILPGTEKVGKFWWDAFSKGLLMYPIIMLLFTSGRIFAWVTSSSQNAANGQANIGEIMNFIIVVAAFAIPYFLIPSTFRLAGGAVATLGGMANDRSKGLFDRNKKFRAGQRAQNYQSFKTGEMNGLRKVGRGFGAVVEPGSKKSALLTSRGRKELMAQQAKLNEMRYGKTERAQATKDNDGMLQAQTYATEAQARAGLVGDFGMSVAERDTAISAAKAAGGFSEQRQNYAARALVATGTGIKNIDQLHSTVNRVAGSNRSMAADLLGEANAVTKGVGRHDLAPGFNEHMKLYDAQQSRIQSGGAAGLTVAEQNDAYTQAAKDIDAVTFMRDKKGGVENMSEGLRASFVKAQATASNPTLPPADRAAAEQELGRLTGIIGKIDQSGTYASNTNIDMAGERVVAPTGGSGATKVIPLAGGGVVDIPTDGRGAVIAKHSATQLQTNPLAPGTLETVAIGVDSITGRQIPLPNADKSKDAAAREVARRNAPQRQTDPRDINYGG